MVMLVFLNYYDVNINQAQNIEQQALKQDVVKWLGSSLTTATEYILIWLSLKYLSGEVIPAWEDFYRTLEKVSVCKTCLTQLLKATRPPKRIPHICGEF